MDVIWAACGDQWPFMGVAAMNCFIHPMRTRIFQVEADAFIRGQVLILDSLGIDQGAWQMAAIGLF